MQGKARDAGGERSLGRLFCRSREGRKERLGVIVTADEDSPVAEVVAGVVVVVGLEDVIFFFFFPEGKFWLGTGLDACAG